MLALGEILLSNGCITRADLDRAMLIQRRRGGRIGKILVALNVVDAKTVDKLWCDHFVQGPLEEALDRSTGNCYSKWDDRQVIFESIEQHETLIEDMMNGVALLDTIVVIKAKATLQVNGRNSLPLLFTIDMSNGFAMLDDPSETMVKRWIAMIQRQKEAAQQNKVS